MSITFDDRIRWLNELLNERWEKGEYAAVRGALVIIRDLKTAQMIADNYFWEPTISDRRNGPDLVLALYDRLINERLRQSNETPKVKLELVK